MSSKVLRVTLSVFFLLLLVAGGVFAYFFLRFQGNITETNVEGIIGEVRPTRAPDPDDPFRSKELNVLVMGVDSRDGANAELAGQAEGSRSDSTYLLRIHGDRQAVDIISIPRDLLVDIPECILSDGSTTKPRRGMFNSAFTIGAGPSGDFTNAAACTRRTFEQNTGVRTDEHLIVKMDGVRDIINTLGGVPMCFSEAMVSPKAGLNLPAGPQRLSGDEAIAFLRARTGEGNGLETGSDLSRLERQHQLLKSLAASVKEESILGDPPHLVSILDQTTRSLAASSGLSGVTDLAGLGFSLRNISMENIHTVTAPVRSAPTDRNRLVWAEEAPQFWAKVASGEPLVAPQASSEAPPSETSDLEASAPSRAADPCNG